MGYSEYLPSAALRDRVRCFWSIVDEPSEAVQEVWPDGCLELLFSPGNAFLVDSEGVGRPFPQVVLVGLQTKIMRVRTEGEVRLFAARLLPFGVREWQAGELEPLLRGMQPLLLEGRFEEAVVVLEEWLLGQPKIEDELTRALRAVYAQYGNVTAAELAAGQGLSLRHLQRTFAAQLGIPPKTVSKIARFARGWSRLLNRPDVSLAELALELGYSDQAHFSNDFHALGGQSPGEFRRQWGKP